jgi:hypothetical protein
VRNTINFKIAHNRALENRDGNVYLNESGIVVVKNENPAFPTQSFDKFIVPNRTCPCSTIVSAAGCSLMLYLEQ